MNDLPPNKRFNRRDAYHMLMLAPLEQMTRSLLVGDGWELQDLEPFIRRCKALTSAYDKRMEAHENDR